MRTEPDVNVTSGHFFTADTFWVAGGQNRAVFTADSGSTWTTYTVSGSYSDMTAFSKTEVFAAGTYVYRSSGAGWSTVSNAGVGAWYGIDARDNTLIVVGASGKIARSTDRGSTWSNPSSNQTNTLQKLAFASSSIVVAVGQSGRIVRSTDGGATWNPITSGTANNLYDVEFFDASNGIAVGENGTVLRTTDGGSTWTVLPAATSLGFIRAVEFGSTVSELFTATTTGLYRSQDGGTTWDLESAEVPGFSGTNRNLTGLKKSASGDLFAFAGVNTSKGVVLRREARKPDASTALSPLSQNQSYQVPLRFVWNPVGARRYEFQVAYDTLFTDLYHSKTSLIWNVDTIALEGAQTYYWRVRGENEYGLGDWSARDSVRTSVGTLVQYEPSTSESVPIFSIRFAWEHMSRGTTYDLQVSRTTNFTTTEVDQFNLTDTTYTHPSFNDVNATYYWRVRARSSWGTYGAYTNGRQFFANTMTTLNPTSPSVSGRTDTNTYRWSRASNATRYEVIVSTSSSFTDTLNTTISFVDTSATMVLPLQHNVFYYWRVRAVFDSAGRLLEGNWSSTRSFRAYTPPAIPVLDTPEDSVRGLSTAVTLKWFAALNATQYRLQVAWDMAFDSLHTNQTTTAIFAAFTAVPGKRYYWRVAGVNTAGDGTFSPARTFATSPNAPALVSPTNNQVVSALGHEFTWSAVEGVDAYHLQISTSNTFASDVVINDSLITGAPKKTVSSLKTGTTHYWRVRTLSAAYGNSAWSTPVRQFTASLPNRNAQLLADSIITIEPAYINILMHALDNTGRGITDLNRAEFLVQENGTEIGTESDFKSDRLQQAKMTLRTVLLLDNSTSIQADLGTVKEAAIALVRNKLPDQQIAIYAFSENPTKLASFTTDTTALIQAINTISIGFSSTNLYGSIVQALGEWTDKLNLDRIELGEVTIDQGNLIVLTDGDDTQASSTLQQVVAARGKKRVYAVGLGSSLNTSALNQIGNAKTLVLTDISQLVGEFIQIQQELIDFSNSFYWLNYISPKRGPNTHTLRVSLRNNSNSSTSSYITTSFNSSSFYSVVFGIVVNPTAQKPMGEDTVFVPVGGPGRVTLETPFRFTIPTYAWNFSTSGLVTVSEDPNNPKQYIIQGTGTIGQSITATITDSYYNYTKTVTMTFIQYVTSVSDDAHMPTDYDVSQNFPNPFNPSTSIRFALPMTSTVRVEVFNILGQTVAVLQDGDLQAGYHTVQWNAQVTSGLYFYKIEATSASDPGVTFTAVKKMMLVK